ncbi:MAG: DUF2911 domain-containing protein [Hymenobacteraceae bacterium]|nr:DUF2911 domain-containing protein [Hymenobacteraceae bacterium]MDX5396167.1 DUF2911 domain-containing protein [Hymenobacteraceae bacterium]MDX5443258.1 DUF2911 domain-containing protein [Hymenobacteraceae bacterium]MDX5512228.1 DUF2911 domain-containing protein [Hymenobacteraceae bacterium]
MKKIFIGAAMMALFFSAPVLTEVQAQNRIEMPQPSPLSTVSQKIGLAEVTVTYSRPSMKDRKIFGDLVPYNKMWRTGANASTKIKFSDDMLVEGQKVPAGEYALYTIPGQNEWTVVLHKNLKHWGDGGPDYNQAEDQLRVKVKPKKTPQPVETFTIDFANLTTESAEMQLMWENVMVPVTLKNEVDSKVMAQIQEKVVKGTNVDPGLYYSAASYYYNNGKDAKQALEWVKKANEKDPKFYTLHMQAKIEAKTGDYKNAIKTAEKSMKMAKEANNPDYVALNEKAIAEWKNKK